jgi:hypothetical protein
MKLSKQVLVVGFFFLLISCGQSTDVLPKIPESTQEQGNSNELIESRIVPIELKVTDGGYTDDLGKPIEKAMALRLLGDSSKLTIKSNDALCSGGASVRSYFFSPNVYGRIFLNCVNIGGKFESFGYASMRVIDPRNGYADAFRPTGIGSQRAELLAGPVGKVNGGYTILGRIDNMGYSWDLAPGLRRLVYLSLNQAPKTVNQIW